MGSGTFSAPSRSFSTPSRATVPARSFSGSGSVASNRGTVANPTVNRSFRNGAVSNQSPSIAFGGHNFNGGRTFNNARVPDSVSGSWDRGHSHSWNNHHFGWRNGSWVIIDNGFGYPYYNDYGYPYDYSYDDGPDYSYAPTYSSDTSSDSLGSEVQQALAEDGYYRGPIDGLIGPQSQAAIAAFQRDHRLAVTGRIDHSTLTKLGID